MKGRAKVIVKSGERPGRSCRSLQENLIHVCPVAGMAINRCHGSRAFGVSKHCACGKEKQFAMAGRVHGRVS